MATWELRFLKAQPEPTYIMLQLTSLSHWHIILPNGAGNESQGVDLINEKSNETLLCASSL
jgi:hypothetical protein